MPPVAAAVVGIGSLIGGAAAGVAGLAGTVASTVGSLAVGTAGLGVSAASGLVSGVGSLVGGAGSLLFGSGQAGVPVMAGGEMGSLAAASLAAPTVGTSGILGALPAAIAGTVDYLGNIIPAVSGAYQILKPPEKAAVVSSTAVFPSTPAPVAPLPVLGSSPASVLTTEAPAMTGPNYILYIALAVVGLILLRRKK